MTNEQLLRDAFVSIEVNANFTEAVLVLRDRSRLWFCHRVGERQAKAVRPCSEEAEAILADNMLSAISMFRLNGKHLEIQFTDGSRWEFGFKNSGNKGRS